MTLPTIQSVSPIHFLTLGASLRDRATLPSPLRGLGPSGGYPSRLRSLRSLRAPLARRLAAPTVVSSARRRSHSRTPPCLLPQQLPSAQSPRRLPSGSVPGTAFPFVRYPGFGPLDALRRLGSHTRRSGLPGPPHTATGTLDLPLTTPEYATPSFCPAGKSASLFTSQTATSTYINNINGLHVGHGPLAGRRLPKELCQFPSCGPNCVAARLAYRYQSWHSAPFPPHRVRDPITSGFSPGLCRNRY